MNFKGNRKKNILKNNFFYYFYMNTEKILHYEIGSSSNLLTIESKIALFLTITLKNGFIAPYLCRFALCDFLSSIDIIWGVLMQHSL